DRVRRLRRVALPGAPVVERHDAVVLGESADLEGPRQMITTEAHDQDQRLAAAGLLVEHPDPIHGYLRHQPPTQRTPGAGVSSCALHARDRVAAWKVARG